MAALQRRRAINSQQNPQDENFRSNFSLCVNEIISSSGTSDAEANKWIKLLRAACPEKRFPSYKSIKKESAISWKQEISCKKPCGSGMCWTLDFAKELTSIVEENLSEILSYSRTRKNDNDLKIPAKFEPKNGLIKIFLILNSDGVRVIKSNKQSLWPLWLALANLPPVARCMYQNNVLAKLWFGSGKPDWDKFFEVNVGLWN